jgi:hypothetical protein
VAFVAIGKHWPVSHDHVVMTRKRMALGGDPIHETASKEVRYEDKERRAGGVHAE